MVVVNDLIKRRAMAAIEAVDRKTPVRAAYLFGSQTTGIVDEYSDIDIAAFLQDTEKLDLRRRVRLGAEVREQAGDDIEIHLLSANLLENPPLASFAKHVIEHGISIWNRD
jgi:predicted nucleotidyltransferase